MDFAKYPLEAEDSHGLLGRLQEECAEVIHIASKFKRFGAWNFNPGTGVTNAEALANEISDVERTVSEIRKRALIPRRGGE